MAPCMTTEFHLELAYCEAGPGAHTWRIYCLSNSSISDFLNKYQEEILKELLKNARFFSVFSCFLPSLLSLPFAPVHQFLLSLFSHIFSLTSLRLSLLFFCSFFPLLLLISPILLFVSNLLFSLSLLTSRFLIFGSHLRSLLISSLMLSSIFSSHPLLPSLVISPLLLSSPTFHPFSHPLLFMLHYANLMQIYGSPSIGTIFCYFYTCFLIQLNTKRES